MPVIKGSTTDIPTAGTRVQLSNTNDDVHAISFTAELGNAGKVFIFDDGGSFPGFPLNPGDEKTLDLSPLKATVKFSSIYVDTATNGNDVSWIAVVN